MQFKDAIITQVYPHKNGELSIKFKVKPEDFTQVDEQTLRVFWSTGEALEFSMELDKSSHQVELGSTGVEIINADTGEITNL